MCYHGDARPPLAPVRAGVATSGDMVMRSTDGSYFSAHFAHPDIASATGVVILPDIRGLHDFYRDLAHRFAEAGHHAVAIDYFGRTAGTTARAEDFAFRDHVVQMDPANVDRDVDAAAAWLRGTASAAFTVGFCLGGALSWRQSASNPGLAGCVGFYGKPDRARDTIPTMRAPILILAAGQDNTPVADVEAFAADVRAAGTTADVHVYPDAPHSFFDRRFDDYTDECADAWRRILEFIDRTPTGAGRRS
jgi:carboxymethylenebutenolidase